MTLLASLGALFGVALSAALLAGIGRLGLESIGLSVPSRLERLLLSLALGAIFLELLVSIGELWREVRMGVVTAVVLACAIGLIRVRDVLRDVRGLYQDFAALPRIERLLGWVFTIVLFLEGFAAIAPLTGSDALHYHFTAQALILRDGFHANWFLSHSFFSGLSHQLILAGLALGSEKLALGWIFLGGAGGALAVARLTREFAGGPWPWIAALAFLLTPVVFWQTTSAGAPDIWMAFFVPLGVLTTVREDKTGWKTAVVIGALAGALAGSKYTGIILAACILLAFVLEARRLRSAALFFCSSLLAGVWPYLRNWEWSGDPVFPFLVTHLAPERLNSFTLASYLADTGASARRGFWQVLEFPFFAAIDPTHLGFWQMLGPLVLCLAPLAFLARKNTAVWRITVLVWILGALGIGLTSGMTRFLLPLLPLALAVCVGAVGSRLEGLRVARIVAQASIFAFLLLGFGGLCLYARRSWEASTGLTLRETYLQQRAPDFAKCEFLNQQLSEKGTEGKVLVFFRHVYYLRVPFLYGNPAASWAMDPSRLQADADWLRLFRKNQIRWIAREPDLPPLLREPLERLEAEKILVPCASRSIESWHGNRIGGTREQETMTLECVRY